MNLIYYNSFAEHMRKTYTSDCSIYLESRGVMELMAGSSTLGTSGQSTSFRKAGCR